MKFGGVELDRYGVDEKLQQDIMSDLQLGFGCDILAEIVDDKDIHVGVNVGSGEIILWDVNESVPAHVRTIVTGAIFEEANLYAVAVNTLGRTVRVETKSSMNGSIIEIACDLNSVRFVTRYPHEWFYMLGDLTQTKVIKFAVEVDDEFVHVRFQTHFYEREYLFMNESGFKFSTEYKLIELIMLINPEAIKVSWHETFVNQIVE